MGLISAITGNASEVSAESVAKELAPVLVPDESIQKCFKLVRDLFVFTDRRLVLIDKQGLTGKKVGYVSIPYKSITYFSVETAGSFDLDAELKIWISGGAGPIQKTFGKGVNIVDVQQTLASYVAR